MALHLARALGIILSLALTTTPVWAGTKTARMSVSLTVEDSCTVTTDRGAPGVACSAATVQPQVEQRTVDTSGGAPGNASTTTSLTIVTY